LFCNNNFHNKQHISPISRVKNHSKGIMKNKLKKATNYLESDRVVTTWNEDEINGARMILIKML
jgi:hypothetical protein